MDSKEKARKKQNRAKLNLRPGEAGWKGDSTGARCVLTLPEVAKLLGISKPAVHQAERRGLHKLRLAFAPEIAEMRNHQNAHFNS